MNPFIQCYTGCRSLTRTFRKSMQLLLSINKRATLFDKQIQICCPNDKQITNTGCYTSKVQTLLLSDRQNNQNSTYDVWRIKHPPIWRFRFVAQKNFLFFSRFIMFSPSLFPSEHMGFLADTKFCYLWTTRYCYPHQPSSRSPWHFVDTRFQQPI